MRVYSKPNASLHCLTPDCDRPVSAKNLCARCYGNAYERAQRAKAAALPMPDYSLPGEEWRPIERLDGDYQISNLGRIRRVKGGKGTRAGKILATPLSRDYCMAVISHKGRKVYVKIHIAVAAAFIGPCPPGHEVNHIDGVKANNAAANLEYLTRLGNIMHAIEHGLKPPNPGELNGQHILTEEAVRIIRTPGSGSLRELGRCFGVTYNAIQHVRKGRAWKHVA